MPVALLCVAQFVVVLDATIVAIALPAMQAALGLSTAAVAWVITAYTLAFGGCLLSAGRLADRAGRRRVFVAGLLLFHSHDEPALPGFQSGVYYVDGSKKSSFEQVRDAAESTMCA